MDLRTLLTVRDAWARITDHNVRTLGYTRLTFDTWLDAQIADTRREAERTLQLCAASFGCGVLLVLVPALVWCWGGG
jgi:hypothetical protein